MGRHQCQKVTGLVVNEGVRLPRNQRRRLRAIRRDIETRGIESALARGGFDSFCELKGHPPSSGWLAKETNRRGVSKTYVRRTGEQSNRWLRRVIMMLTCLQHNYATRSEETTG